MSEHNSAKIIVVNVILKLVQWPAIVFILVGALAARAEEVREIKLTPSSWAKAVAGPARLKSLGIPTRIAIIKRNAKNYEAIKFDQELTKKSFLDFSSFDQNQLSFEINKSQGKSKCGADLRAAFVCLNVDMLLDVTRDPWALVGYDQAKNKIKTLAKDRAGEAGGYAEWVAKKLNYDGILIAREGNYFLALASPSVLPGETQVLMLNGSSDKLVLSPGAQKGAGLLVVKKSEGRFAILEKIVTGEKAQSDFRAGEKIIVEKVKATEPPSEKPDEKAAEKEEATPPPAPPTKQ